MEKTKKQNKETKIGKIIYGFLLFLPLIAIAVTCCYAIFNKNAYKSYYGNTTTQETYNNNNLSSIDNNQIIYLNTQNYTNSNSAFDLYTNSFEIVENGTLSTTQIANFNNYTNVRIYCRSNNTPEFYGINENNSTTWITNSGNFVCKFVINNTNGTINNPNGFYTITYENLTYVSEVFYYSINKVEEHTLFNWASNTQIYTVVNNFTNLLGITNTFIPLLMTYWLLITVVYLIYDLGLMMLLICHRKIHELGDNI